MVFPNFKSEVPAEVQNKINALALHVMENWDSFINIGEMHYLQETIESIHGNAYNGFIPFQDGGFQVSGFYSNNPWDNHFTPAHKEYNARQSNNCWKQFLSDNNLESGIEWDNLTDQQQSNFTEYECEFFEPAMVQFEVFADGFIYGENKPSVTVRVSVNYKDAPYYRGKYAEDLNSTGYDMEEFMQLSLQELFELHKGKSKMLQENNYLIHAVGFAPIKFYGNAQQAIAKGSNYCYMSQLRRDALLEALLMHGSCQWQYEFDSVVIELDE